MVISYKDFLLELRIVTDIMYNHRDVFFCFARHFGHEIMWSV